MKITGRGLSHLQEESVLRKPWQEVTVDADGGKLERMVGSRRRKTGAGLGFPRWPQFSWCIRRQDRQLRVNRSEGGRGFEREGWAVGERGMDWEFGVSWCKLLYVGWISSKVEHKELYSIPCDKSQCKTIWRRILFKKWRLDGPQEEGSIESSPESGDADPEVASISKPTVSFSSWWQLPYLFTLSVKHSWSILTAALLVQGFTIFHLYPIVSYPPSPVANLPLFLPAATETSLAAQSDHDSMV